MRRDAEGTEPVGLQFGAKQLFYGVQIGGDLVCEVELGDAHAVADTLAHRVPVGVFAQREAYHQVLLPHALDTCAFDGATQVTRQTPNEHRAVIAL